MSAALLLVCLVTRGNAATFRIEVPAVTLRDVPVAELQVMAVAKDGAVDAAVSGPVTLSGVRRFVRGEQVPIPEMRRGVLRLASDRTAGEFVFIDSATVTAEIDGRVVASADVTRLPGWASLVPPLIAVTLALVLRDVLTALCAAVFSGAWLLWGDPWTAFLRSLDRLLVGELVPGTDGGVTDASHVLILFFTFFLGATVAVMTRSGGAAALLAGADRFATTRERGQVLTWALGFVVFFDDYANTLLVGGTMRPLTDRLRISRAKLAFLVDATSAPVAGLAIVSTWVGVEIGYIQAGFEQMGVAGDAYTIFLKTLPYRFYPIYLLAFTLFVAATGRDFGPMLRCERRTRNLPEEPSANTDHSTPRRRFTWLNAVIPLAVLLVGLIAGMAWTGIGEVRAANPDGPLDFWAVLDKSDPTRMLFLASFAASATAAATAVALRSLSLTQATEAWLDGVKAMVPAASVLVLAWMIARVCDPRHLDTAGYLVHLASGFVSPHWLPALAFVLSGAVAFATGSSWSTMALLIPLFMTFTAAVVPGASAADDVLIGVVAAILAGAIFGDHCSPISDTTVLSSAASGCDHVEHVATQMPYALTVAAVSLGLGYIPAGFGVPAWLLLPFGCGLLYGIVRFCGRSPVPAP